MPENGSARKKPADSGSADTKPADSGSARKKSADSGSADTKPADQTPDTGKKPGTSLNPERQKRVTGEYRAGWARIWGKKP